MNRRTIFEDAVLGSIYAPFVSQLKLNWTQIKKAYKTPRLYAFGAVFTGLDAAIFPNTRMLGLWDIGRNQTTDWKSRTGLNLLAATKFVIFIQASQFVYHKSTYRSILALKSSPIQLLVFAGMLEGAHRIRKMTIS